MRPALGKTPRKGKNHVSSSRNFHQNQRTRIMVIIPTMVPAITVLTSVSKKCFLVSCPPG